MKTINDSLSINNLNFRVRKMNAIELFAISTIMDFKRYDSTLYFYNTILECFEVQVNNQFIPVKEKGTATYYPEGIENDIDTIQTLINFFTKEYLMQVFQKSNE